MDALSAAPGAGGPGDHSLYIKDGRLHYVYNWLGERVQVVSSPEPVPTGTHVPSAEFDTEKVADAEIVTQPGFFSLCGDGRD